MTKRTLIIVESPTKSETLTSYLDKSYVVMASKGHISNIADGGSYWNTGIEPSKNFEANFVISQDRKTDVEKLKKAVSECDAVILCSDPDREGEAIAWSLRKFLKIPKSKCKRATYTEVTKSAILYALNHPRDIDEDLVHASHARQKADKIIGYRLSPISRKQINAKSVGRCQSAALKLIVMREDEISNFIPEKYTDLFLEFDISDEHFKAKYDTDVKLSKNNALKIKNECDSLEKQNFKYKVTNIENKEKKSNAKPPFTTSTFQQEVSSKLGLSIKRAMECAQKLFEGLEINGEHVGLITYMRTDSSEMSKEFASVLKDFVIDNYGTKYYSPVKVGKKQEHIQEGHECLRITDLTMTPDKLSKYIKDKDLLRVYDIIYRRTLASSMSSAVTSETIYTISIDKHNFKLSSKELLFDGYQKIYTYKDKSDDVLCKHVFVKDEVINDAVINAVDKETQPPARYKEGTLQKALETSGIGRPSTWPNIIETVLSEDRGYCVVKDKSIYPTERGIKLSRFLDENFSDIINIDYTKEMEDSLDRIAEGKLDEIEFLQSLYDTLETTIKKSKLSNESSEICPKCGKPMKLINGKYGRFLGCSGYPKCKETKKLE